MMVMSASSLAIGDGLDKGWSIDVPRILEYIIVCMAARSV